MTLKLHAIYKEQPDGTWAASIEHHSYIFVEYAEDLESAKILLSLYTAEEMGARRHHIIKETIK